MKNFKYLFLASAFTFVVSCSTEDVNETSFESENIEVISTTIDNGSIDNQASINTLRVGDITFQTSDDGTVTRKQPGQKTYTIINESSKTSSLEIRRERGSNMIQEYVITNPITREFVKLINIKEHKGYYTFDMVNDLGLSIENVTFEGDLSQLEQRCPPCVVVIVGVLVDAAVELLSDSPLEECTAAMNLLTCSSPYMEYEEGGWFSGPSCSVGCN
ncbi:hypothetical protein ACFO3O_18330 [Dokdonia ponticola]|uniref:Lipoprotein n=1 Tax=Dokdonia ponticola TaxID=2041041 RepID=A0ABV9I153_9FLAO